MANWDMEVLTIMEVLPWDMEVHSMMSVMEVIYMLEVMLLPWHTEDLSMLEFMVEQCIFKNRC